MKPLKHLAAWMIPPSALLLIGCSGNFKKQCLQIHGDYYVCMDSIRSDIESGDPRQSSSLAVKSKSGECREDFETKLEGMIKKLPKTTPDLENIQEEYGNILRRLPGNLEDCGSEASSLNMIECYIKGVKDTVGNQLCEIQKS